VESNYSRRREEMDDFYKILNEEVSVKDDPVDLTPEETADLEKWLTEFWNEYGG
jgi:hypothetical protein